MSKMTPEQWAEEQMRIVRESLPQCGHVECMVAAVVQLSKALIKQVGTEVPIHTMSNELVIGLAAVSQAHMQLDQMQALAAVEKGTLQ